MPAVLVHGNPETPAVWRPLVEQLQRTDVVCLQLPGFGTPAPSGFGATKDEYVDWLVDELEVIGEPVDLVGHDWGGGFVLRLACERPDLLRTWATDVPGLFDPEYVWHDMAQLWQAPGVGEQWLADTLAGDPEQTASLLTAAGMTPDVAGEIARSLDEEMGRCILALYRSAAQPAMAAWGADIEAAARRPGLAIIAEADPYARSSDLGRRVAARAGARVEVLPSAGHWWMLEDPAGGAALLDRWWATS